MLRKNWTSAAVTALAAGALWAAPAEAATCPNAEQVRVPGAERQLPACLDDLTTAGTRLSGHTDQSDWAGLHSKRTVNPPAPGVP